MFEVEAFGRVWTVPNRTKWIVMDTYMGHDVHAVFTKERPELTMGRHLSGKDEHFMSLLHSKASTFETIGKLTEEEHRTWLNTL